MSNTGVYGTKIGSYVQPNDVDIFYSYSPSRNSQDALEAVYNKVNDVGSWFKPTTYNNNDDIIEGLYNLNLPSDIFNQKGYYTIYIKPKEIEATITDIGTLSSYPDVKGLIVTIPDDNSELSKLLGQNNSLVGYRVVYYNNSKRQEFYRIVTSNNKCEAIVQQLTNVNQKAIRYRYNDNASLSFITLTPTATTSYKDNTKTFIGSVGDTIHFINTKFEPLMIEIEMVEHDIETVSTMLEGSQVMDLDNGLITTFNSNNEIYAQHEVYTIKDDYTYTELKSVKKNKGNSIDFSQTIND